MSDIKNTLTFHDGRTAPQLGLGLWQVEVDVASSVVKTAIEAGYRLIDTAAIYGNEKGVGQAVAQCGVEREALFITTKLWNDDHGYDKTMAAFDASLKKLGLDYVDLYLIHWPVPTMGLAVKSWEAMIQLRDEGRAKSIGVSNFNINHLQELLDQTGVMPVVNQIELHPRFQQKELRRFHAEQDIVTEAWSPLAQGTLFDDPLLNSIAAKHRCSVAQVLIRWHIQLGNMVIPKSVTPKRIRENFNVFRFALDDEDMASIDTLDQSAGRIGPDPDLFHLVKK